MRLALVGVGVAASVAAIAWGGACAPVVVLSLWALVGWAGSARPRSARSITWRAAAREGRPDDRRLEALRRLAGRGAR